MHRLTEQMLKAAIALQVAALEWDDCDVLVGAGDDRVPAIEQCIKEASKIAKQMKKEF